MKITIAIILLILFPFVCFAQIPAVVGNCPPGWERDPNPNKCLGYMLPVTVKIFTAKVVSETVVLNWEVGAEYNHSHYIIQRSKDCQRFEDIGTTTGYSFTDYLPMLENYYRLVSVDLDQTRHYYKVVFASLQAARHTVYTAEGKHLGEFRNLSGVPTNQVLIINQKQVIRL